MSGVPVLLDELAVYEDPPSPVRLISVWLGPIPPSASDARCSREARAEMTVSASWAARSPDRLLTTGAFDRMEQRSTLFSSTLTFLSCSESKKDAMSS